MKEAGTRQPHTVAPGPALLQRGGAQQFQRLAARRPGARRRQPQVIAGSHRGPGTCPRLPLDGKARVVPGGTLSDLPDIEGDERFPVLAWALEPGDAVFFDMLALHGARSSRAGRRRIRYSLLR